MRAHPLPAHPLPRRRRAATVNTLYYALCVLLVAVFLFPILWSALTSLKPPSEAAATPPTLWPSHLVLDNYATLAGYGAGLVRYVGNSLLVAVITIVLTSILSLLGGYGFSRFQFVGRNVLFVVMLATLMIPFQSILTPLYLILRAIHLQDTLLGLALVYTTFQLPFAIFVMRNSFDSVPREIEEAALIDGCSSVTLLTRVMFPVVLPGVVTVALFAFFGSWNEFLAALIFLNDSDKYTLPVMLLNVQSGLYGSVDWGAVQAGMMLSMLPCIALFLFLQRYYLSGLTQGAVK
ncbi:ABC transporter permease (plasmid) [Deinococcus aetherius]|uniref:ABC transporter permease n=1 Tax=Deinococcus aetherius TaxID=200252 RepID=A0ABM8AIV9_9DEIO|nr:carbohydrate ABC transporter permease [Deinococcus aetherius]BDP43713.1 ABC transporter permease [Deinococcus aetherius]